MGQTGFVKARIKAGKIRQDKARAGQGRRLCAGHSLAAVALLSRLSELSELALLPAPPRAAAPPAGAIGGVIRTAAPSPCPPSDQATPPGSAPATPTPYPSPPLPLDVPSTCTSKYLRSSGSEWPAGSHAHLALRPGVRRRPRAL